MKKLKFTLIELLVAMAVFALLMASLMQFFGSAQKLWSLSSAKSEMFEDARVALELISRDLQCTYYSPGSYVPFEYKVTAPNKRLSFVAYTNNKPSDPNNSRICKIHYFYDASATDSPLFLAVVGNMSSGSSGAWDFPSFFNLSESAAFTTPASADTAGTTAYISTLIPYVADFSVILYDEQNNVVANESGCSLTGRPPYTAQVTLKLLSRLDYTKWKTMSGAPADTFKDQNARCFTKRVVIGDRGQYD